MTRKVFFQFQSVWVLCAVLLLLTGSVQVNAEAGWLADPQTGCKVWHDGTGTNRTFTWTGGCKNGFLEGNGTLQWLEAGEPAEKYTGPLLRGKPHGKGVLIWSFPAARYEGGFVEGQRSGKGTQTFANGDRFEGDWLNDQPHGKGLYTWLNEDKYQGDFVKGKAQGRGVKLWTDGTRYEGEFANGEPDGIGIKTWIKGSRYEGEFVNGQMEGYGVFTLRNGRVFRGRWEKSNYLGP